MAKIQLLFLLGFSLLAFTAKANKEISPEFMEDIRELAGRSNKENTRLLVFVSFSMPKSSIQQYMMDAKTFGAELFLVGVPGNDIVVFSKTMQEMLSENSYGISVDERQFTRFNVSVVPTFVLVREEIAEKKENFDKLSGHVPLKTALKAFANDGELSFEAEKILKNAN